MRLADGRVWVFKTHDKLGVLCDRIAEGGCAKVNIPRKSQCNKKSDRKTKIAKFSVEKKSFSFKKQCYLRYLRNLRNERRLFAG